MSPSIQRTLPPQTGTWLTILILFAVPLGPMSTDIFTPSMPAMIHALNSSQNAVQWTISVFLLAYSFGQIIYGTLSDFIGRKAPMIIGLVIFAVGCYLATIATDIQTVLVARFLQGLGVSSSSVLTKTMAGDCFKGAELAQISSLLTLLWGVSPIVAPALGGYLQAYFGWTASFYCLLIYGFVCLVLYFCFLPETIKTKQPLVLETMTRNYIKIASSRVFLLQVVCITCAYCVIQVFNMCAPFIIQNRLGYNAIDYGHIALLVGLFLLLGALFNKAFVKKVGMDRLFAYALFFHTTASVIMLGFALLGALNIFTVIAPTLVVVFCSSIIFTNSMAKCIGQFPENVGSATALMSFLLVLFTAAITFLMSFIHLSNQTPLAIVYVVLSLSAYLAFALCRRHSSK